MKNKISLALLGSTIWCAGATPALAQSASESTTLIETVIPDNYDRDRNVSVLERPRPDYDPLGILAGSFKVLPRLGLGAGATSNVLIAPSNVESDVFLTVQPGVRATSDWSRHQVTLQANGLFSRYADNPRRNDTNYDLRALGRLDVNGNFAVTGEAQFAQLSEQQDLGAIASNLAVLSRFNRGFLALRGEYRVGQARAILSLDRTSLSFQNIPLDNGLTVDQSDRDRIVTRATGQLQYALSPSISFYGQATYSDTDYSRRLLSGLENRDSEAFRVIGGLNFDLAGFLRGKVGLGYVHRDYKSALYDDTGGFSAEAKIEYFFSELTTFTFNAGRTLEDASIGSTGAFFDNRFSLRVDHELLRNLLLNAYGEYGYQKYINTNQSAKNWRFNTGARYLSSRWLSFDLGVQYFSRDAKNTAVSTNYDEWRGMIGVTFSR